MIVRVMRVIVIRNRESNNDSENNECEENGGGYLSSASDYTTKFGGDFERANHLNAIR